MYCFGNFSEVEWEALWLRQAEFQDVASLPLLADENLQRTLHGTSGVAGMRGALKLRKVIRGHAEIPSGPDRTFLDFGCGWGRHIRVFLKDFAQQNIYGVDIDNENLNVCRAMLPDVNFVRSQEGCRLPLNSKSMDFVLSFSVFSHINEASAAFWLRELYRVLKPGGLAVVTSWGKGVLEIGASVKATGGVRYDWERNLIRSLPDLDVAEETYATGKFIFGRHGSAGPNLDPDVYGISLMPPQWVEDSCPFVVEKVLDDPSLVPQTTMFLRKK